MPQCKLTVISISLFVLCVSCGKGTQLTAPSWTKNPTSVGEGQLKFDGYYTVVESGMKETEKHFLYLFPVVFTKSNITYIISGASTYKNPTNDCSKYAKLNKGDLGKYYINEKEIIAYVSVNVSMKGGSYFSQYFLNFRGKIKDENTIIDWKAVPPFPSRIGNTEFNDIVNSPIFKNNVLKFKSNNAVNCLRVN